MHEEIRAFFCLFLSEIGNSENGDENAVYRCKDFTNETIPVFA
ncbi:hypothetical protein IIO_01001 [Bacillus cereus VD115]|nr:hypothetical protein IIO_01001 [Bacillus cereus VD115]